MNTHGAEETEPTMPLTFLYLRSSLRARSAGESRARRSNARQHVALPLLGARLARLAVVVCACVQSPSDRAHGTD